MENLKTSIGGWILGAIPLVKGILEAYESGAFTGQSTVEIILGVATIVFGIWAKDPKK